MTFSVIALVISVASIAVNIFTKVGVMMTPNPSLERTRGSVVRVRLTSSIACPGARVAHLRRLDVAVTLRTLRKVV
jgi:hypothetical protein